MNLLFCSEATRNLESNTKRIQETFLIFIGEDSDGNFVSINENAHDTQQAQALQSQGSYRPGLLTQHSYHDHLTGKTSCLQDEASKFWRYS